MGNALAALQDNPATLSDFARSVGPTDLTGQATQIAFARLARTDVENARSLIPIVARAQQMRDSERLAADGHRCQSRTGALVRRGYSARPFHRITGTTHPHVAGPGQYAGGPRLVGTVTGRGSAKG